MASFSYCCSRFGVWVRSWVCPLEHKQSKRTLCVRVCVHVREGGGGKNYCLKMSFSPSTMDTWLTMSCTTVKTRTAREGGDAFLAPPFLSILMLTVSMVPTFATFIFSFLSPPSLRYPPPSPISWTFFSFFHFLFQYTNYATQLYFGKPTFCSSFVFAPSSSSYPLKILLMCRTPCETCSPPCYPPWC